MTLDTAVILPGKTCACQCDGEIFKHIEPDSSYRIQLCLFIEINFNNRGNLACINFDSLYKRKSFFELCFSFYKPEIGDSACIDDQTFFIEHRSQAIFSYSPKGFDNKKFTDKLSNALMGINETEALIYSWGSLNIDSFSNYNRYKTYFINQKDYRFLIEIAGALYCSNYKKNKSEIEYLISLIIKDPKCHEEYNKLINVIQSGEKLEYGDFMSEVFNGV